MFKIDKHITVIDVQRFQYPSCNCLWIDDEVSCLIDTGFGASEHANIIEQELDLIINSHGHIDHCLNNNCFPTSKVLMHQADQAIAQSADKYLEVFGLKALAKDPSWHKLYLQAVQYQSTSIDGFLEDKQVISLGSTNLQVLHLPGHSPGHCGFLFPEQGFIFTADIDFSTFGPWYANMNSSLTDFLQSIDLLLALKPDYMISGHGEAIIKEDISRRLIAYRDIIYDRERRIVDLLNSGHHSLADIAREYPVYRHPPKPEQIFYIYEQVHVLAHLRHLQELGYVIQEDQHYYLKDGLSRRKYYDLDSKE